MMNQFVAGDKLAENTKTVALALTNDDGNGSDPTQTASFIDWGILTDNAVDTDDEEVLITFEDGQFYWRANLNGI